MDDKLLEALGRAQRSTDPAMPPSESELAALLQPFAPEEEASILDGAFARIDATPSKAKAKAEAETAPPSTVVDLADRKAPVAWIAMAVAIAAAVLLWFAFRGSPTPTTGLPAYDVLELGGGVADVRGASQAQHTQLKSSGSIDWKFAPKAPAATQVGVALLATGPNGETAFSRVRDAEVSDSGAVRIRGPLSSYLSLSAGEWTIQALFAAPNELPTSAENAAAGGPWQKAKFQVTILPP